ncbi:MAG: glycosyltransferase [Rhodospirillales bacterium]|nr:glycosyltransferase [Rhodospirillales bacterium]
MFVEALAANFLTLGAIHLICAVGHCRHAMARLAFACIGIATPLRYLWWRWFETVLPVGRHDPQGLFILVCFAFELIVLLDSILSTVVLSRSVDRSSQADAGETWARNLPRGRLPSVDVLIPTYNEDRDVLERTIVGATSLDYPDFAVWVLDDGRRPWVAELAASKGAGYLTRPDNEGGKAGNVNAAISRTKGELVAVLDADFVPRHNFLWRTVGLFRDEKVACVQTPQYFFNKDPVQTNLGLGNSWADDQRLFFDIIMPSRDAWGLAFCCGTGFLMRRSALAAIGGVSTGSVCEDILTSIELKRRGLETIYLNEELCIGLAPESVKAFFVQRTRWSRGNIQLLFLRNGIFGGGLTLFYRLAFLPTYWMLQLPARIVYTLLPLLFILTGLLPMHVTDYDALLGHLGPLIIGGTGFIWWLSNGRYFPILSDAANLFIAIKVGPTTLASLIKPFGTSFRVTPKGTAARGADVDRVISHTCIALLLATTIGISWNALDDWRLADNRTGLLLSSFWAILNAAILGIAALIAHEGPRSRSQERFLLDVPARLSLNMDPAPCVVADISLLGAFVGFGNNPAPRVGAQVALSIPSIGLARATVVRSQGNMAGVRFVDLSVQARKAIAGAEREDAQGSPVRGRRSAVRRRVNLPAVCAVGDAWLDCIIENASLSGASLAFPGAPAARPGDRIVIEFPDVGFVSACVRRETPTGMGILFEDASEEARDGLIRALYCTPRPVVPTNPPRAGALLETIFRQAYGRQAA